MARVALILANPTAKRGKRAVQRVVDKLMHAYANAGWRITQRYTEHAGARERQIVSEFAEKVRLILVVGGDGTVRETVLGMTTEQRQRVAIGFIPMGNANVLAREVGIAWNDEDQAIVQAITGNPKLMDVGAVDGEPTFLLMLDVGYFAEVVHMIAAARKHRATNWLYALGGDALYGVAGLLNLLKPRRAQLLVNAAGHPAFTTSSLTIANASVYAKSGAFCPEADPGDGLLDFNAARSNKTLRYSLAAIGRKPSPSISHLGTTTSFTLHANDKPFLCQTDGDPLPSGPARELRVEVMPAYYSLMVPQALRCS
ncbi:MAG: diacylglycerol kinase (ATP) [Planctomycetota bacterium]|jgi:diacylglycerol kinase (ATP)